MTTLSSTGLGVIRDGNVLLSDVSIECASGTWTAVIGPNGAGKSTLLASLAGLLTPSSGDVTLDNISVTQLSRVQLARRRAYLPQNPRIEWPMSVEHLVTLGLTPTLSMFGELSSDQQGAVNRTLGDCDLLHLRHRAATRLSGGELARAMLARSLVGDPEILIVDEPTAGLDPRHAFDACARLRAHTQAGRTVIVAVHHLDLAARYADRFVALRDGRVVIAAPACEALQAPVLERVFDLPVHVERAGASWSVRFAAGEPAPCPALQG